ncbi:uncharacterized protein LOC117675645 [Pantherophis guttatus]|uniref:Uncharacterized protein LOC117675645 n=1 Tax=Pantherophis guttatus TaxID=94885 RepID=A0ABM3YTL4_PANGU|nr:uncharacterized protein LOC117675645 [Pantherophis guttatus]
MPGERGRRLAAKVAALAGGGSLSSTCESAVNGGLSGSADLIKGPRRPERLRRRICRAAAPQARHVRLRLHLALPTPSQASRRSGVVAGGEVGPGRARALAPGWVSHRWARRCLTALLSSPMSGRLRPLRAPRDCLLHGGKRLGHQSGSQSPVGVGGAFGGGPSPQVGQDAGEGRLLRLPDPFVLGGAAGSERLRFSLQKHGGQDPLTGPFCLWGFAEEDSAGWLGDYAPFDDGYSWVYNTDSVVIA